LFKASNSGRVVSNELENLIDSGVIEIEAVTYIRGRSIPDQFIIVDEAQNLTPHEIKTIVTRVGNNTKIVFTGDPYQIDHPYLDSNNNGLTYLVEKFKNQSLSGHITFKKGERSNLAQLAAELLQ
jgi:PhoH-like ATPase